jgi:hypothetical protein
MCSYNYSYPYSRTLLPLCIYHATFLDKLNEILQGHFHQGYYIKNLLPTLKDGEPYALNLL